MANIVIKKHSAVLSEGLEYVIGRANGSIKALKTGWNNFDNLGLGGIEWNTSTVIGARPGVGKTLIAQSLSRNLQILNKDQDFNVLNFQFEMLGKNVATREFAGFTKKSLRYLLSAGEKGMPPLSEADLTALKNYVDSQQHRNEYLVDVPLSVFEMKQVISKFYEQHKKPFIITLDHTILVRRSGNETSEQDTLTNLAALVGETKNIYPISWIILSQLNRELDDAERQVPGRLGNFPTSKDVYGSDKFNMYTDNLIAYNRPAKYNLAIYGPEKFIIDDPNLIAAHVLKNRMGTTPILWYKADYPTMTFLETTEPQRKQASWQN